MVLMEDAKVDLTLLPHGSGMLCCPRCGNEFLHHRNIKVFDRREDEKMLMRTTVAHRRATSEVVPSQDSGNPSSRRSGLAIQFWCEGCDTDVNAAGQVIDKEPSIELTIEQHKGVSYLRWREVA